MIRVGTGTVTRGMNRMETTTKKYEKTGEAFANAMAVKVTKEKERHAAWVSELAEDIGHGVPFTRQEAARAWGTTADKATDRLRELREVGLVRKARAGGDDLPPRCFVLTGEGSR